MQQAMTQARPTTIAPEYSTHARKRMNQRAIPDRVVETLLAVGKRDHDHVGGVRIHLFDKRCRERFARCLPGQRADRGEWARYSEVYAVVDATTAYTTHPYVITVARRESRMKFK